MKTIDELRKERITSLALIFVVLLFMLFTFGMAVVSVSQDIKENGLKSFIFDIWDGEPCEQ